MRGGGGTVPEIYDQVLSFPHMMSTFQENQCMFAANP
jgi:hypothetical protein